MKIQPTTFAALRNHIATFAHDHPTLVAQIQAKSGGKEMRFRWNLLWDTGANAPGVNLLDRMYDEGLNDSHIDTALRAIVKELALKA